MRLSSGTLNAISAVFLREDFTILGCLSFEERCCSVAEKLFSPNCIGVKLLEVRDPVDAFPDYSAEASRNIEQNRQRLFKNGVNFESSVSELLTTEDKLLDILADYQKKLTTSTIVLDITSLPKRYFCFFIRRMLIKDWFRNVVVTYTRPGPNGYTHEHLAEDPMTCDYIPGYAAPLPPRGDTLVMSVGFESLSIRSLLEVYGDKKKGIKIILSFPPDGDYTKRVWNTLRQVTSGSTLDINRDNLEVIAAWDAEQVYRTLELWEQDTEGLALAPFGPKPHTLGMALFAVKHDSGLYYTQPKSYNPSYSKGIGESWAYVVKWDGIPCFNRLARQL